MLMLKAQFNLKVYKKNKINSYFLIFLLISATFSCIDNNTNENSYATLNARFPNNSVHKNNRKLDIIAKDARVKKMAEII